MEKSVSLELLGEKKKEKEKKKIANWALNPPVSRRITRRERATRTDARATGPYAPAHVTRTSAAKSTHVYWFPLISFSARPMEVDWATCFHLVANSNFICFLSSLRKFFVSPSTPQKKICFLWEKKERNIHCPPRRTIIKDISTIESFFFLLLSSSGYEPKSPTWINICNFC